MKKYFSSEVLQLIFNLISESVAFKLIIN